MSSFAPIPVDLSDRLENPGDSYPVSGRLDASSYEVGEKTFSLDDGLSYDVVFTNAGDGILVTGIVRAAVSGACDRCLEPAHFEIAG